MRNLFHPSAIMTIADSAIAKMVLAQRISCDLNGFQLQERVSRKGIHKVIDEYNGVAQVLQSFMQKILRVKTVIHPIKRITANMYEGYVLICFL